MRRFVSGLALLLAFLAGTAALTSYVADQLLWTRAGPVSCSVAPWARTTSARSC